MQQSQPATEPISPERIHELVSRWLPAGHADLPLKIHRDTTQFFEVEFGDVVELDGKPFLVRHNAKEGRFGLDDEVKHWVKGAIDLTDGTKKIIKLVFHEKFIAHVGDIAFECFRSPKKEARILNLVAGHKHFMHGYAVTDTKGNVVRVLDFIYGPPLSKHIESLQMDHDHYFSHEFPIVLDHFLECVRAVRFLHENGEKHGDIRRDHILVDREKGYYRWIDFDFNYRHRENIYGYDLFGLGNILVFLVGKGDVLVPELNRQNHPALNTLTDNDCNIVFHHRIVNLKKVFPYIPESLNNILLHFSKGANRFYDTTQEFLDDLEAYQKAS